MARRAVVWLAGFLVACVAGCSADDGDVAHPLWDGGMSGSTGDGASGASGGLPCDVAAVLAAQCTSCHGAPLAGGAPMPLLSYADLTRPSLTMPTMTTAQLSVVRMQSATSPMPPGVGPTVSAADVATMQSWIMAGTPMSTASCNTPTDPLGAAPTCTSGTHWTRGNHGSDLMQPGQACISCHTSMGEGPDQPLTIGGTVYPSGHEPDDCNGAASTASGPITVDVTDAMGRVITMTPNAAGNFQSSAPVTFPITAAVHYMGRTRSMIGAQPSGDCNLCHTQSGAMGAPGRVTLP